MLSRKSGAEANDGFGAIPLKKSGVAGAAGLIPSGAGTGVKANDGGTPRPAGRPVLRVLARTACAGKAPAALDRPVRQTRRAAAGIGSVLQRDGAAFDRPGAADPDADRRLLLRHPL